MISEIPLLPTFDPGHFKSVSQGQILRNGKDCEKSGVGRTAQ